MKILYVFLGHCLEVLLSGVAFKSEEEPKDRTEMFSVASVLQCANDRIVRQCTGGFRYSLPYTKRQNLICYNIMTFRDTALCCTLSVLV